MDFIKTFKQYLTEAKSDKDVIEAINVVEDIDKQISSINTDVQYKDDNSSRITVLQLLPAAKRTKFVSEANEVILRDSRLTLAKVAPARSTKDYAFNFKGTDRYVYVKTSPSGKRGAAADPNELMTAGMVGLKLKKPTTVEEMDSLIQQAKENIESGKVKGYSSKDLDAFEKDYINSAQAVSAAIAIQKFIGGRADTTFMTGQKWDKEIQKFRLNLHGMNDFNSSDIVIKKGKQWYGISLKKKMRSTSADPTILNKALTSLFLEKSFAGLKKEIDDKTDEFFTKVIDSAKKQGIINKDADSTKWKRYVGQIDNAFVNSQLKGNESLFRSISKILNDNSNLIADRLIKLVLKTDLKTLHKIDFDFALVTGIGNYGPRAGVSIEDADIHDIDTITEKLDEIFSKSKPQIVLSKSKKQAYETGATAAKLFYELVVGSDKIMDIEVRYKGSFTSQPQLFATLTKEFKSLLHS